MVRIPQTQKEAHGSNHPSSIGTRGRTAWYLSFFKASSQPDDMINAIDTHSLDFFPLTGFSVVGSNVTAKPQNPEISHSGDLSAFPG
jgi:hypothetical protein